MIRTVCGLFMLVLFAQACQQHDLSAKIEPVNWEERSVERSFPDTFLLGTTYLSLYPHIYSRANEIHLMTSTISIRNPNPSDTVFLTNAVGFNSKGEKVRTFFNRAVYVAPMESLEIILDEMHAQTNVLDHLLFDWAGPNGAKPLLIEAVMISTSGQQGLSFITQGQRIK